MRPIDQASEQVHWIRIKVQEAGVGLGYLKINRHCKEIPPLNVVTSVLLTHAYTEALAQRLQNESPLRNNREKICWSADPRSMGQIPLFPIWTLKAAPYL